MKIIQAISSFIFKSDPASSFFFFSLFRGTKNKQLSRLDKPPNEDWKRVRVNFLWKLFLVIMKINLWVFIEMLGVKVTMCQAFQEVLIIQMSIDYMPLRVRGASDLYALNSTTIVYDWYRPVFESFLKLVNKFPYSVNRLLVDNFFHCSHFCSCINLSSFLIIWAKLCHTVSLLHKNVNWYTNHH